MKKVLAFFGIMYYYKQVPRMTHKTSGACKYGSLVKRLRRRPLTAETGVRFPYELLILKRIAQPEKFLKSFDFRNFFITKENLKYEVEK